MLNRYRIIQDPGHGWLEVPLEELDQLGVTSDQISSYSYVHGAMAYLEEDCDAMVFIKARGIAPRDFTADHTIEVYECPTSIRHYQPYPSTKPRDW